MTKRFVCPPCSFTGDLKVKKLIVPRLSKKCIPGLLTWIFLRELIVKTSINTKRNERSHILLAQLPLLQCIRFKDQTIVR